MIPQEGKERGLRGLKRANENKMIFYFEPKSLNLGFSKSCFTIILSPIDPGIGGQERNMHFP